MKNPSSTRTRSVVGSDGEAPLDRAGALEADLFGERLREVELATRRRAAVDDLGQHALAVVLDEQLDVARQHRVRDPERARLEQRAARGALRLLHLRCGGRKR